MIRLFVGDTIEEPAERALISRLRIDLGRRGVRATLYANFFPATRRSPQVDLLVRTECRTAHVEIKGLRPDVAVRARPNGLWVQLMPDGTNRSLGNYGRQALNNTYAISDAMRGLAQKGTIEAVVSGDFYRHIDTIVGTWEAIPDGSDIEPPPYVTVLGYRNLLRSLTTPGPKLPWTDDDWDAFARSHHLFQPRSQSQSECHRRSSLERIADYRRRVRPKLADGLSTFVDLGVADDSGGDWSADGISRVVVGRRVVAVVGPSGSGKSLLAQYLATSHCDDGRLVIWIQASDYENRFSVLIARAMAPYSVERWDRLVGAAQEFGIAVTVVLDGLNECPTDERSKLLEQLQAFMLRHPGSVLMTSTASDDLGNTLEAVVLRVNEPDEETRREILSSHRVEQPERISAQFRTPYELSIAASYASQLPTDASVTELHDAYIRHFVPTEKLRAGLRSLASHLHATLRTSMSRLDTNVILHSPELDLASGQVDELLTCQLLGIEHHRVRFNHELIVQFLAAETIALMATSGQALGLSLSVPANTSVVEMALRIECDHRRVWEALKVLEVPELVFSALTGDFGLDVAEMAAQGIRDVLQSAVVSTASEFAVLESEAGPFGYERWVTNRRWAKWERVLLASAGRGLTQGMFVDEVCELIDRTDDVCLAQVRKLTDDGDQDAVTRVVAATFKQTPPMNGYGLAGSYVVAAFEKVAMRPHMVPASDMDVMTPNIVATIVEHCRSDWQTKQLAHRLALGAAPPCSWGRFYLALLAIDPRDLWNQSLFPSLLRQAWDAGGRTLQAQALYAAEWFACSDEPYRSDIVTILKELDGGNWALRSLVVEVLAQFGELDNSITPEVLREHVRDTLSHRDDTHHRKEANTIISRQYEDQRIVGPYRAAIEGLTEQEKARLLTMSIRGIDPSLPLHLRAMLHELKELVPTRDSALDNAAKHVFNAFLDGPQTKGGILPHESVAAYLVAISGWAKFESELPPESIDATPQQKVWYLIGKFLHSQERDDVVVEAEDTWGALLKNPRDTIVALESIKHAGPRSLEDIQEPIPRSLRRLVEDYPVPLCHIFEQALNSPTEAPTDWFRPMYTTDFIMQMLGRVGDASTVALLHAHTLDHEGGTAQMAVETIRQINRRVAP